MMGISFHTFKRRFISSAREFFEALKTEDYGAVWIHMDGSIRHDELIQKAVIADAMGIFQNYSICNMSITLHCRKNDPKAFSVESLQKFLKWYFAYLIETQQSIPIQRS